MPSCILHAQLNDLCAQTSKHLANIQQYVTLIQKIEIQCQTYEESLHKMDDSDSFATVKKVEVLKVGFSIRLANVFVNLLPV